MKIWELDTPALCVDIRGMQRNMDYMNKVIAGTSMRFYPHYKSHKCPAIAKMQLENGAEGITCAKLGEALDLYDAGVSTIVIANQIVQPQKLLRLAELAQKCNLTVCVDHAENVFALENAMRQQGSAKLRVLVEYDVGMKRCGVDTFEEFLCLAKLIGEQPHLVFAGIQAYAGQLSHEEDARTRFDQIQAIEKKVARLKAYCEDNGICVKDVCGGSTGFAEDKPKDTVYTQVQFGSYLFMDRSYRSLKLNLEHTLFVETTVLSVKPDRVVVDCGTKSMTMDQYPPYFPEFPDAKLLFSEEHTTILVNNSILKPGDMLRYIPGHCSTTINTFDKLTMVDGDNVIDMCDIASRGKAQ